MDESDVVVLMVFGLVFVFVLMSALFFFCYLCKKYQDRRRIQQEVTVSDPSEPNPRLPSSMSMYPTQPYYLTSSAPQRLPPYDLYDYIDYSIPPPPYSVAVAETDQAPAGTVHQSNIMR
ncbi:uncharacterized protein [Periplaneta americana]|uniref:uncharacterized protein n=1 Tax=Periplaneta americana TaxID=6978 RepID=UPI0037E7E8BE